MPELPEVETTRRGLQPHIEGLCIREIIVRNARLRWPIDANINQYCANQPLQHINRRGKYLLLGLPAGHIIIHLGMSGSLRMAHHSEPASLHDHVDIILDNDAAIRLRDPRRFGAVLWQDGDVNQHPLLAKLGPEPLDGDLATVLWQISRCNVPLKNLLMDSHRIVGIGNIYANEALFDARLSPFRKASTLDLAECNQLANSIRHILETAIIAGGSTLRDFVGVNNQPGYFQQTHAVYGRTGLDCPICHQAIVKTKQAQRSTFWCPECQQ